MHVDTKTILETMLSDLQADETLSEYVSDIAIGGQSFARKRFPFIAVAAPSIRAGQLMAGSGILIYDMNIYAGMKSIAPGVAYSGSPSTGKKGIVHLCEDIVEVCRNNRFGSLLTPPTDIRTDPRYWHDKAETIFIGMVSFSAEVRFNHR